MKPASIRSAFGRLCRLGAMDLDFREQILKGS